MIWVNLLQKAWLPVEQTFPRPTKGRISWSKLAWNCKFSPSMIFLYSVQFYLFIYFSFMRQNTNYIDLITTNISQKINLKGPREWCLKCKFEDPSQSHRTHVKKSWMAAGTCYSRTGEAETGEYLGIANQLVQLTWWALGSVRALSL